MIWFATPAFSPDFPNNIQLVRQLISGCLTKALKQVKNAFLVVLGPFWAYVRHPHNYIQFAKETKSKNSPYKEMRKGKGK